MSAQVIGYLGENGVRDVRIPIGHLLDKWQGLRPSLVMVPVGGSDDEAYPVQYTQDGTDLVWHVSDADTAVAGTTKAAVRMVDDGGRVGMDEPFQVIISPNLSAGGEPPVVIKPWVDKLVTLVPRAESAAERAENAAQNWETGTAPNALALGGKPPSYYLPAENALTLEEIKASTDLSGKIPQAEVAKMLAQSIRQGRFDRAYDFMQTGVSVPEQWGAVVRLSGENWGTNFISDSYFLFVTSGGDLYTGNQVNGATNITWRRVSVG